MQKEPNNREKFYSRGTHRIEDIVVKKFVDDIILELQSLSNKVEVLHERIQFLENQAK